MASSGSAPPAEPRFILRGYGDALRYWRQLGHGEEELEELWRSVEKVEVRCRFIKYRDPARILRVREGGQYFEVKAKFVVSEEPEGADNGQ